MKKITILWIFGLFLITLELRPQQSPTQSPWASPFSQAKFVPDISLILDGSFVYRNVKNYEFKHLSIPGLQHAQEEEAQHGHSHASLNGTNGFNFNYGELAISSIVDPYFNLMGIFHLSENGIEVEEAYFTTRQMPHGFQLKGGKFLSAFSRTNEQHAHVWDFANPPLVQKVFFGEEGLNEKGIQWTWVAPVSMYWMVGSELLAGENESSFGKEGFHDPSEKPIIDEKDMPNLVTGFTRTSFEFKNWIFLLGILFASGESQISHGLDVSGIEGHGIKAKTQMYSGELTLKYLLNSYRNITFQGEYRYRKMDGTLYEKDTRDQVTPFNLLKKQSGWYGQVVYKYGLRSRAGIRYDQIYKNQIWQNGILKPLPNSLYRLSAMLEFNPTEFSRIRLQYSVDHSLYEENLRARPVHEWILQYNLSIGAHGAHPF